MSDTDLSSSCHTGGRLCGNVRFEIHGELRPVLACHCNQCARTTGHYMAATAAGSDLPQHAHSGHDISPPCD